MDDKNPTDSPATNKTKEIAFPLHLRIPPWMVQGSNRDSQRRPGINGQRKQRGYHTADMEKWETRFFLHLPMEVSTSKWYENSVAVERGPLVYALKMDEKWEKERI